MTIYFHIGTEKTGTSSVQHFLHSNRNDLLQNGIFYPRTPGLFNHTKLLYYALNESTLRDTHLVFKDAEPEPVERFRKNFSSSLEKEIRGIKTKPRMVLFSNEHCSARLYHAEELMRLRKLFRKFSKDIRILVYLRRQDDLLLSSYSTNVRSGSVDTFKVPPLDDKVNHRYNYLHLLNLWSGVFGRENMVVRIFERDKLAGGNVIHDLMNVLGMKIPDDFHMPGERNRSLDPKTLEFLRRMNRHIPFYKEGRLNEWRGELTRILEKIAEPSVIKANPDDLKRFYEQFTPSNQKVARIYLGKDDGLFFESPGTGNSGEKFEMPELELKDAIRISARLWIETQKIIKDLEAEIASLKAANRVQDE